MRLLTPFVLRALPLMVALVTVACGDGGYPPLAFHFQVNAAGQPLDGVYEIAPPWGALPCRQRFRIAGSDVTLLSANLNADCYLRTASFRPRAENFRC
jgi:hypothetical protein